jgi:hypothetical protein
MSSPDSTPGHEETPVEHIAAVQKKKNLYLRLTSSMPLVVTILVHIALFGIAGAIVVQQSTQEKKRTFEASTQAESAAVKQVEHRLQVARRGGASGGAQSPVSANRIVSSAAGGLTLPEMPDLPSMGAGGFGGFAGMGAGVGMGAGSGMATSLGSGTGLGGRGFMSLSFLGMTSQNASKVVFVVDTSTEIMEPRKGGFQAFTIIREEIMRLVGRLPPSAQFNVVLFRPTANEDNSAEINLYEAGLVPATSDKKNDFFTWMAPVNAKLGSFGPYSASRAKGWSRRPIPPEAGIDPLFLPPVWSRAVHAALEMGPDVVYVITSTQGAARRRIDQETVAKRQAEMKQRLDEFEKEVAKEGLKSDEVRRARGRAFDKAWREVQDLNRRLVAAGKNPIVITSSHRIFERDVQAELRKHGVTITLDKTGWSRKDGTTFDPPADWTSSVEGTSWEDFIAYYARLQRHLIPETPALNIFLFVGPDEKPEGSIRNLTTIARRNSGNFQLLTTQRLEEIKARAQTEETR